MTKEELIEDLEVQCSDDLIKEVVEYIHELQAEIGTLKAAILVAKIRLESEIEQSKMTLEGLEDF